MTLRVRIAVTAAAAVFVAILVASAGVYIATERALHRSVDGALAGLVTDMRRVAADLPRPGARAGRFGGAGGFVQLLEADGAVRGPGGAESLPVTDEMVAVAAGDRRATFSTVTVEGEPVRILTVPVREGLALQVARPLTEVADILAALRRRLAVISVAGAALAAGLGLLVARRAIRPVHALTELAEDVAATQDLTKRIEVHGDDEVGRLAGAFNVMLAKLEQARHAQQQLIADASHELRTPLTSLRTNIEVLMRADELSADQRRSLISDVVDQLGEFSALITGLVELARGAEAARAPRLVRLDQLVASVTERSRGVSPAGQPIELQLQPTTVLGESDRLERAIANLIDNAVKYGDGRPIQVRVADGRVEVHDHGDGIAAEHLPHVFDRFYRAPEARGAPGSGLGLAIVQQVAQAHGGSIRLEAAQGGGTVATLQLPPAAPAAQQGPSAAQLG